MGQFSWVLALFAIIPRYTDDRYMSVENTNTKSSK